MIKLESAHIEEVRGIRKLDIDFGKNTFAISGPSGSGKSGVIDAIEFGLTGQIGRLTGRGTRGLSVTEHGPHVDKTKFLDAAFVELDLRGVDACVPEQCRDLLDIVMLFQDLHRHAVPEIMRFERRLAGVRGAVLEGCSVLTLLRF